MDIYTFEINIVNDAKILLSIKRTYEYLKSNLDDDLLFIEVLDKTSELFTTLQTIIENYNNKYYEYYKAFLNNKLIYNNINNLVILKKYDSLLTWVTNVSKICIELDKYINTQIFSNILTI